MSAVSDVTEATFQEEVLERSKEVPVVVDFWAGWCGPCRQLGPVLEKAVDARGGQVVLAKVDVDANPRLAQAFQVQGIPAVKAFRDGEVVAEFVGAQPPPAVERFMDGLAPSEVDALVAEGGEPQLRRALELEPGRADAALPLARLLLARGERDEALRVAESVPGSFAAEGLAARLRLEDAPPAGPDLGAALAAVDAGDHPAAVEALLAALADAPDGAKDDLRRVLVGVLDEAGPASELARDARRRMAALLY